MPDTDSRPLVVRLSDPSGMSRLRLQPLFEAAVTRRFVRHCNSFGTPLRLRAIFDYPELDPRPDIGRLSRNSGTINPAAADSGLIDIPASLTPTVAAGPAVRPLCRIP
jgi:hypothetical protein